MPEDCQSARGLSSECLLLASLAVCMLQPSTAFLPSMSATFAASRKMNAFVSCASPSTSSPLGNSWLARDFRGASAALPLCMVANPQAVHTHTEDVGSVQKVTRRTIAVAGATGRVGSAVVTELLKREPMWKVVAAVRDPQRSDSVLGELQEKYPDRLTITICDLEKRKQVRNLVFGVDQVIWCASGFSGRSQGRFKRLAFLMRVIRFAAWKNIGRALDQRGPMRLAEELAKVGKGGGTLCRPASSKYAMRIKGEAGVDGLLPRVVMLSSAAVTRPGWSDEKKREFPEAASIPIVKLNPLGLLNVKLKGEEMLRATGMPYTIVRSCGINATHPDGAVKISTGDTAMGRINPTDLARVLITILDSPVATGKTFELYTQPLTGGFFERKGTKGDVVRQLLTVERDEKLSLSPPTGSGPDGV